MALITLVNPETKLPDHKSKHKDKPSHQQQPPSKHTVVSKQEKKKRHPNKITPATKPKPKPKPTQSSWDQIKNLLTCKQIEPTQVHEPSKSGGSKIGSSCGSICSFRDVVHGNTRVVHRADNSPESSSVGHDTAGLLGRKAVTRSSRSNGGGACTSSSSSYSRTMQFRKLSGCYECHMIVDPSRYPFQPRSTICACPQCGEVFPKIESLELHQAVRHAVSELGPEDSGRNIVEIIFKSSWVKKEIHSPAVKIDRILKVHNTHRTIQRFEDCRDSVKSVARKNPRCSADGNELLRFHCATLSCSLGSRGSSSLCSITSCHVCSTIRHGFSAAGDGVLTTASSGRAHDSLSPSSSSSRRAMIVCRVIAGRVKRDSGEGSESAAGGYDSVAGSSTGIYNNLEELVVFNPRAILPCFVVIYKTLGSDHQLIN